MRFENQKGSRSEEETMKKEITVVSSSVYDARALAQLVGIANEYSSKVTIEMENRCINVKSIMGVMGLGLDVDKKVSIEAVGEDEEAAVAALERFLTE